jgi:hypothetical protein
MLAVTNPSWGLRAMGEPILIPSEAFYDDKALVESLGLRYGSIERARKAGELRFTKRGGRILYLGRWVQEWLAHDEARTEAQCAV